MSRPFLENLFRDGQRRLLWRLHSGLALAFLLEISSRQMPQQSPASEVLANAMSMTAILVLAITAIVASNRIPQTLRARHAVLAGVLCLVATQLITVTGHTEAFDLIPLIGNGGALHDLARDLTFVGGFTLLLAGFYFLVFDLVDAKHSVEVDRERLADEVDERREVAAALKDSKERYSKIFESTDEAIVLLNESMQILQFNPRFPDMLGYRPGDLTRMDPLTLVHPLDRALFAERHHRLLVGDDVARSYEFRMLHRTGATVYISGSFDRIERNESVLCSHGILRDVTKLKEAQQAQLFRLQLESIISTTSTRMISGSSGESERNIVSALQDVGDFLGADRAYVIQFDDTLENVNYRYEWVRPGTPSCMEHRAHAVAESVPGVTTAMQAREIYHIPSVASLPKAQHREQELLRAQGIKSIVAVPMSFQGSLVGLVGLDYVLTARMVSEDTLALLKTIGDIFAGTIVREETRDALRRSEEKYRRILGSIVEGYYEFRLDGKLVFFNDAFATITGYSNEELDEMSFRNFYPSEVADEVELVFDAIFQTGAPMEAMEWPMLRKDGSTGFVEASGALIENESGQATGFRGIIRDVTERHHEEEERQQLVARMQQAQKLESLGVLAGGIAHDFNNLLMGVLANASIALDEIEVSSSVRSSLENIELSAQRAAELADQMLTYSGKANFVVEALDLSRLVHEMGHLLTASTSKRVTLVYDLDDALPAVEGDPTQLRQVAMNLITNASEAMENRDGVIKLNTYRRSVDRRTLPEDLYGFEIEDGDYVCLEVRDEGCGMDDALRARIFDPFFTSKFTGRGLGLANVIGIVRGHHGAIAVESSPGVGTSFTVFFRASDVLLPSDSCRTANALSSDGEGTVLIVDDEELIRDVSRRILERGGYEVLTASDGLECLEQIEAHGDTIVAVLLDMTMPRMNGVETLAALRDRRCNLPVILSSGFNEHDARKHLDGFDPHGFIKKPYRASDLLEKLQDILSFSAKT